MANFLLVYFPIDKVFTVERASDFNLHEGDISIGLNVKREFLTTVFHDGGRSNERRVEYEGVVIFHSSSEKSCTQKQTLFEKLLTRIPESEHVATLMSEGKRALQDSRDCGRAWRSSSTVAELEKVNRQDEKKLCKRKSDYASEESQVKKIAVLNQKVDRQFHKKAEEGLNRASRNSRKWRLSEEEVRKMAEMTGFSGELDNWKLKRASAASDQVRVKPQPPANPTACRMDRMDWFGSWREETPCEGSGVLDRSQSGQGNPRGETQTVESHQPTPRQLHKCTCVCASRHSHATSPNSQQKQLESIPGRKKHPVQSPAVVLHHSQATVPAKPSETHVEPPKSTPCVVSHSSQNPLCSNSTTPRTSPDRVQDSTDVDLSRPVSILLLQEENKRLKTENFALRKEIEALHKLVNNASIFGITQDHVNALSEVGKILQSCVRPGSCERDSAQATFISDGIQTSSIPVGTAPEKLAVVLQYNQHPKYL
ncbi:uncharacterized protein [Ptychodera flava]|uniref:uncharacterized protein n=1 Tax=Ptychodera flava TaxID=63121 RepID=UPI00396A1D57